MNAATRKILQQGFNQQNLTLHLGAGVSVASGLPTWERLVLAMSFMQTAQQHLKGWRPFPNYLYAISEYLLKHQQVPLEISARKLRKYFTKGGVFDQASFVQSLHDTLYMPFSEHGSIPTESLRKNPTLEAVKNLIRKTSWGKKGVRSVISYNYDNLLELSLGKFSFQSVSSEEPLKARTLPIYHVHGHVPFGNPTRAQDEDLIFTEDEYHRVARDPYHWSNLVQVQSIAGSVTLMIGLSLADRNMRRLLDAVATAPVNTSTFAILMEPTFQSPDDGDLDGIHARAIEYIADFEKGGLKTGGSSEESITKSGPRMKKRRLTKSARPTGEKSAAGMNGEPRYRYEIRGIMERVYDLEKEQQNYVLDQLGVTPIWIKSYNEIPKILQAIPPN